MTQETFPTDDWYLKIDDENRDIINNWRINIIKAFTHPCRHDYINSKGEGGEGAGRGLGYSITTEQFKKYVLKETSQIISSDLSYLIDMFKELNIK